MNSKKVTIITFIVALIFLFLNILFEREKQSVAGTVINAELPGFEIDSIVISAVKSFSIPESSIKKRKSPYKNIDSLLYSYSIRLPFDLPIPVLLQELKNQFNDKNTELFCNEIELNGTSVLEIKSGNTIKFYADLNIDKLNTRNLGKVAIFLTGFESLPAEEQIKLLQVPEPFMPLLNPSKQSAEIAKQILTMQKQYAVLISDEIDDVNFKMLPSHSRSRLIISVKNISANFRFNPQLFINTNAGIYSSTEFVYVEKEFSKRGFRINPINSFVRLDNTSVDEAVKSFVAHTEMLKKDKEIIFIVNASHYSRLGQQIHILKKKGVKIVAPIEFYTTKKKK